MSKQPEALRLADALSCDDCAPKWLSRKSAAELRRLHSVNAELLKALQRVNAWSETLWPGQADDPLSIAAQVRAAIAKATEAE